jgi:hypothetical protein
MIPSRSLPMHFRRTQPADRTVPRQPRQAARERMLANLPVARPAGKRLVRAIIPGRHFGSRPRPRKDPAKFGLEASDTPRKGRTAGPMEQRTMQQARGRDG